MWQSVADGKAETRGYSAPASEGRPPESGRHTLPPSRVPLSQQSVRMKLENRVLALAKQIGERLAVEHLEKGRKRVRERHLETA